MCSPCSTPRASMGCTPRGDETFPGFRVAAATSWRRSRRLYSHLDEVNQQAAQDDFPIVKTATLPAGTQFLNVIESVFSGMVKGIIHNRDYPSAAAVKDAIARYFSKRNDFFIRRPKHAGRKIWGA